MNRKYLKVLSIFLVMILVTACTGKKGSSDAKREKDKEIKQSNDNIVFMSVKNKNNIIEGVSKVEVNVINNTEKTLSFGMDYFLQKYIDDNWVDVPFDDSVIDVACLIDSKKERSFECEFGTELESGKYRIIKSYIIWNHYELGTKEISVEFNVKKR